MMMKTRPLFVICATLICGVLAVLAQTDKSQVPMEPVVSLKSALSLAEQYISDNTIDVSAHFMESIRLVTITDNPQSERQWVVTWVLKTPSRGGEIFVNVKMDKSCSMNRGR